MLSSLLPHRVHSCLELRQVCHHWLHLRCKRLSSLIFHAPCSPRRSSVLAPATASHTHVFSGLVARRVCYARRFLRYSHAFRSRRHMVLSYFEITRLASGKDLFGFLYLALLLAPSIFIGSSPELSRSSSLRGRCSRAPVCMHKVRLHQMRQQLRRNLLRMT